MTTPRTPVLARFVIGHRVPRALRENVLGDLEEEFTALAAQHGVRAARRWYRQQVMRSLFAGWPRGAAAGHVHGPGGAVGVLDAASRDLRGAIRSTTRHPRFSVIVVGTLALGIGATTAVFSLANWLLFQPVPGVAVPSRIATVWFGRDSDGGGITVSSLTYPNHTDLTPTLTALHGFAGHQLGSAAVATGDGIPDQRAVGFVMHDYFDVLGVPMQLGRAFLPAEDDYTSGGAYVAVVSDRLWRAMLHADEHAIGKTLLVNGVRVEVIGVAHPGFHGVERLDETDVWMPGVLSPMVNHFPAEFRTYDRERGGYYEYVGRLADGATFDQLRQQLAVGLERLAEAYPTENEKFTVVTAHVFDGAGLPPLGRIALVPTIRLLMGIVLLVLLIACANVANLLLFRGIRRESENAMRRALGASPLRIAREQLVESGVLALVGAVAGVAVAFGLMRLFHGATIAGTGRPIEALTVDWRVLGFTLLAALVSAVVFGIVPAVLQGRVDLAEPLKATARVAGGRTTYIRNAFAVLQLSVSLTLLVGALLFVRTIVGLTHVDLGFDPNGVVTASASPDRIGYDDAAARAYLDELRRRAAELPGVGSVALARSAPFSHRSSTTIHAADADPDTRIDVLENEVSRDYFTVLGIPRRQGRLFEPREVLTAQRADSFGVVILSQALATRLFPDRDPLGQHVAFHTINGQGKRYQVVGVVGNVHWSDFDTDESLFVYQPLAQVAGRAGSAILMVKTAGVAPEAVLDQITRAAARLDPTLPLVRPMRLTDAIANRMSQQRLFAKLLGAFAALALILSAVGVYGLISQGVAARTREFGIRMALGADRSTILTLVTRGAVWLGLAGVGLGLASAFGLSRIVEHRLFGVTGLDPLSYGAAAVVLFAIAVIAGLLPARLATTINPVEALKSE